MIKRITTASLLTISLFMFCSIANAQTKLTILYKHGNIKGSLADYLKPTPTKWSGKFSIDEFTINDTITYYQTVETFDEKDEYTIKAIKKSRTNKPVGKAFIPKANYCNYSKGFNIESVEWKDDNYLVKDNLENKQKIWNLSEDSKVVFGYPCKQATQLKDGEVDVIVWYTENFKCNLSFDGDSSLPGTILETFYPKTNTLITALDLQIETNQILYPKLGIAISKDDFIKLQKNKKRS